MEKLITGFFKEELRRNREKFNKEYLVAKRSFPRLNSQDLTKFLTEIVTPILEQSRAAESPHGSFCIQSLYSLALELVGKGYYHRYQELFQIWQELLIAYRHLLLEIPDRFPRHMFNALLKLFWLSASAAREWQQILFKLSALQVDFEKLSRMGIIAGWRQGLAQFRELALALTAEFDSGTLCILLGLPGVVNTANMTAIIREMQKDPWSHPDRFLASRNQGMEENRKEDLQIVRRVSTFRGFGGHFRTPPLVEAVAENILAYDEDSTFVVKADIFGAYLARIDLNKISFQATEENQEKAHVQKDGTVFFLGLEKKIPLLAHASSFAVSTNTLAVTIPTSHSVFLVAKD